MNNIVSQFEELKSWQHGRELASFICRATNTGAFAKDYAMRDQVRRAVISIASNIAEGFERGGRQEFIQFLSIAKGSCGEVRSQLHLAQDQGYVETQEANQLRNLACSSSRLIAGLMTYLRRAELRGTICSSVVREAPDSANEDAWTIHPEELSDDEANALAAQRATLET